MKKTISIILSVLIILVVFAADKLKIVKKNLTSSELNVSGIDSITFTGNDYLNIFKNDNTINTLLISEIDSMKFTGNPDTVKIVFSGQSVAVNNPLAGQGVDVVVSNADVTVFNSFNDNEIRYLISGNTTDGSLKFYSSCKSEIILNGISLTNNDGPAINNQSSKKTTITLISGKTNTLTDGSLYSASTEDQKASLFSEGQLIFKGDGTLNVKGNYNHAICSDDYIEIEGGIINVTGAVKDGIHAKGHFNLESGTLGVLASGNAVECETGKIKIEGGTCTATVSGVDSKGLKCDSTLNISGGTINLTVSGNQAKGLKSGGVMNLSGGTLSVNTSGNALLTTSGSGYEPSYCTAIKCDTLINLNGTNITITSTGVGGKGISSDNNITVSGGIINITNSGNGAVYTNTLSVSDVYTGCGIEADGNINIIAGNITVVSSGTAAKSISADGDLTIGNSTYSPVLNVNNTGTRLLVSGTPSYTTAVYAEPKGLKSDGNMLFMNGTYTISTTQQGAENIDCDSNITINDGVFTITNSGAQSKAIKSTGAMTLSGGTIGITSSGTVILETYATSKYDPSYCTSIKSSGIINVNGANITITHTGSGSRGISGDTDINITSGVVKITTSGVGATYINSTGATDSYSASCIKTDTNLSILGGTVTCSSSGAGGKGISTTGTITIGSTGSSPTLNLTTSGAKFTVSGTDYCHPKTMVATGAVNINNGTNTLISTDDGIHSETSITINGGTNTITATSATQGYGEGVESKYITINGGTNTITASNDGINATAGTVYQGTESNDGSLLTISGGVTYVTGADAIDSNGSVLMSGGTVFSNGPASGAEEYCDVNGTCTINGGVFVGCGSAGMQKTPSTSSTQPGLYITTTLSTSTMYSIAIGGTGVVAFKPKNGGGVCYVTCPAFSKGASYIVYTGGTYTGSTTVNNLYYGGSFSNSGATSKKSGTLSTSSTINSISF